MMVPFARHLRKAHKIACSSKNLSSNSKFVTDAPSKLVRRQNPIARNVLHVAKKAWPRQGRAGRLQNIAAAKRQFLQVAFGMTLAPKRWSSSYSTTMDPCQIRAGFGGLERRLFSCSGPIIRRELSERHHAPWWSRSWQSHPPHAHPPPCQILQSF